MKLTADQVLVSNWIAGSRQAKTRLNFSRAQLRLDVASTLSSKLKNGLERKLFSCIFSAELIENRFDIYSCGQDHSGGYAVIEVKHWREINLKLSIYFNLLRDPFFSVL